MRMDIEAIGLDEQIRKLEQFDRIAAPHIRRASQETIGGVVEGWQGVVNGITGLYQGSIVGEVKQVVGLKSRSVASTDALAPENSYPYPFMLEKSKRFRKTFGKVSRMLQRQKAAAERAFAVALERIVKDLAVHG